MESNERFERAKLAVLGGEGNDGGIGTLTERALHKIFKLYYEPDPECHEIKIDGAVADIFNSGGVTEIQTKALARLAPKLDILLPDHVVTVVYPFDAVKYLRYIDEATGDISPRRKSPKGATVFDTLYELYNIRNYLAHPNFRLRLVAAEVDEYRKRGGFAFGRRAKKTRIERIPSRIIGEYSLDTTADYALFFPEGLADTFCAADYNRAVGRGFRWGFSAIRVLLAVGLIEEAESDGKRRLFRRIYI